METTNEQIGDAIMDVGIKIGDKVVLKPTASLVGAQDIDGEMHMMYGAWCVYMGAYRTTRYARVLLEMGYNIKKVA